MVTSVDVYKEIRRLQLGGATSQRQAARMLGISRNTVKKYWDGNAVPWEHQSRKRASAIMTPEVIAFINACLDEDEQENIRKQQHTARRIYHRLKEEHNFTGSESSVRRTVHDMKALRKATQVYVPLRFPPGDSIQIDWGEATVYINGEKVKVNLFCARMCHSCAPYVIAYYRQNLESFLDAIIHTIQYFGGVPRHLIFDNARIAVKSGFGAHAAAQDDYKQLSAHYGFEPVFCNPSSGNEKSLVENLVGYIRRNVCVPLPRVRDLDEMNGKLLEKCTQYLAHQVQGRPSKVGVMLAEDRKYLQPMPKYVPDVSKKLYPVVSRYSTVTVETNRYSVPCCYCGKRAVVKAFPNYIEIWIGNKLVASHGRLFGHREEHLDLQHYLPILAQKGRAIRYARPVQSAVPAEFLNWLDSQNLKAKQMVGLLEMCADKGYAAVMSGAVPIADTPLVEDPVTVPAVDLMAYDALYRKEAAAS